MENIFLKYKKNKILRVIDLLLKENGNNSIRCAFNLENIEYFDFDQFSLLETSVERLRYFVLYKLKNRSDLELIMTKLIIDMKVSMKNDIYVVLKVLQTLFLYQATFIPLDANINSIIFNSMFDINLSYDAKILIELYYEKLELRYSNDDILTLIEYSIYNNDKCRTNIWKLELQLILLYNYCLPSEFIKKIINLYGDLNMANKHLLTQLIFSMLISENEENKNNIKEIFYEDEELIRDILIDCSDGENITVITTILYCIRFYNNYDYFSDIIDLCILKKDEDDLNVYIIQEDDE